jgi:hypothetical protein
MASIRTDAHPGLFPTLMRVVDECGTIEPAVWVRLHDVE